MTLKAYIENQRKHGTIACHNFDATVDAINFAALVDNDDAYTPAYSVDNSVATIKVRGLLVSQTDADYSDWGVTGYNIIKDYIERANDDDRVSSIILDVDSNGGMVQGLWRASSAVTGSTKPIDTFVSGNMYSAAYWVGVGARSITATKDSGLGSIGVIANHFDISKKLEKDGVTVSTFKSGKHKDDGSRLKPLDDETKARMQAQIDDLAGQFFAHVATHRNTSTEFIKRLEADTFAADEALSLGLIDAIASSPSTNPAPEEDNMDLTEAKAKIDALEAERANHSDALAQAKAEAQAATDALAQANAKRRDDAIAALAEAIGKTFSDDDKAAMSAMSDDSFAFTAKQMKISASTDKALPDQLTTHQATAGRENEVQDDLDVNFAAWSKA